MRRYSLSILVLKNLSIFLLCVFLAGCITIPSDETKPYYTAHNIWFENPQRIYAINFKKGVIIPAGTRVFLNQTRLTSRRCVPPGIGVAVEFETEDFGRICFIASNRWQSGLSLQGLVKRTFSHANFTQLVAGLTTEEIELIKKGEVKVGMSRKAVLISYGYPPRHHTPILTRKVWRYWVDRDRQRHIVFDDNWKIAEIVDN